MAEDDLFGEEEKKKKKKNPHEDVEIKIRFKPIYIERAIYWIVILALAFFVFRNPFTDLIQCQVETVVSEEGAAEAGGAVITDVDTDAAESDEVNETATVDPVPEPEPAVQNDSQEDTTPVLTGVIDFVIPAGGIYTEKKTNYGKIEKVVFTIKNGKGTTLKPKVVMYGWDSETDIEVKNTIRGEWTYPSGIGPGEEKSSALVPTLKSFTNLNLEKTVKLVLSYENGDTIKEITKKVTIS